MNIKSLLIALILISCNQGIFGQYNFFGKTKYFAGDSTGSELISKDGDYYTMNTLETCKGINTVNGDMIEPTSSFRANDSAAFIWIHITNVYRSVRFKILYTSPTSETAESVSEWIPDPRDQGYSYWTYVKQYGILSIKGYYASLPQNFGAWKADLFIEEDNTGVWNHEGDVEFSITESGSGIGSQPENKSGLFFISPNPIEENSTVNYSINTSGNVSIFLYDLFGRKVISLENSFKNPGTYSIPLNIMHNANSIASGDYLCSFVLMNDHETIRESKIIVIK